MIAILYEGKKEKKRIRLTYSRADIIDTLLAGKPFQLTVDLPAPCRFDRMVIWENGEAVLKQKFGQVRFVQRTFTVHLSASSN